MIVLCSDQRSAGSPPSEEVNSYLLALPAGDCTTIFGLTMEQSLVLVLDDHGEGAARAVRESFEVGQSHFLLLLDLVQSGKGCRREPLDRLILGESGGATVDRGAREDLHEP